MRQIRQSVTRRDETIQHVSMMDSNERRIDLPPWTLWVSDSGAGTPVVLIHGLSGSGSWWRRNIPALAEKHHVYALDLAGFGKNRSFRSSTLPPSFEDLVALVVRWIEGTFDETVHLVGHSMGGHLAIHVAATRPDLIRSLTLVGSTGIPFDLKPLAHLRHATHPPKQAISFSPLLARDFFRAGPSSVAVATARILTDDARDAMHHLRLPTLLVWGDRDPFVPESYGVRMQQEIRGASLVVVPGAGHVAMWDNAEAFNHELLEFLRRVDDCVEPTDSLVSPGRFSWGIAGSHNGISFRRSGRRPSVVLVHGLGVSSSYFRPLAAAFHSSGIDVIAPDLPGFGASVDAPATGPQTHAASLLKWASAIGLERAVWVGHSTGSHVVNQVQIQNPDAVLSAIYLSPVWTERKRPLPALAVALLMDIPREPPGLVPHVVRDYWRTGAWRWFRTFLCDLRESSSLPGIGPDDLIIAGAADPLIDWDHLERIAPGKVRRIPGAHAINYSNPHAIVSTAGAKMKDER